MREIKFRVWHNDLRIMDYNGKLVTNYSFEDVSIGDVNYFFESTHYFKKMQYTGIKDKNDREIYEGDFVKIIYCEKPLLITYDSGMFLAEFTNGNVHYLGEHYMGCEVLGNFYENPELLEVK